MIQATLHQSAMKQGILALGLLSGISTAAVQEPPRSFVASFDICRVVAGNDQGRLICVGWGPGQRDKPQSHPPAFGYLLTDCSLKVTAPDGISNEAVPRAGYSFAQDAVASHTVGNVGKAECRLIMAEPK